MPLFDVSKASTLGSTDLGRLTVKGLGVDLQAKLTESGLIQDKEAAVAVLIKVEGGKLQGTCWTLVGGLKTVVVPTHHLGGERGKTVSLNLGDLSVFTFPGDGDPRQSSNRSYWVPGMQLTTKLTTSDGEVTDKKLIEADPVFKKGFVLRVSILPLKAGEAALWLSIAPGTKESVKAEAEKKGMTSYDARIPTLEVPLGTTATGPQATVRMGPMEGDWIAKGWGNYPLIMVILCCSRRDLN